MSLNADDLFYRPLIPRSLQAGFVMKEMPIRLEAAHVDFLLRDLLPNPLSGRMRPEDEKWQIMREIADLSGDNVMEERQGTLWQANRRIDRQGYIDIPKDWWARGILLHMIEDALMRSGQQRDLLIEIRDILSGAEKGS